MEKKKRIACVIGTRPEVIKMAPVVNALRLQANAEVTLICTAQHRQLLDHMLTIFDLKPDVDLNIMKNNQSLAALTGELFQRLEPLLADQAYDLVLAQGDTTTTWVTAQVCFYHRIPFGHIEAGLRSYDFYQPFPEEMNRVFISKLATLHFAPTIVEKDILLKEGVSPDRIIVTGNTVIDALYLLKSKNAPLPFPVASGQKIVLTTLHRRENFGELTQHFFSALIKLSQLFPDVLFVYPVHPNPNVRQGAYQALSSYTNIRLLDPLPYDQFVSLMNAATIVLTDSGGLQEEAPALGKPVLVLRNKTERPLIIEMGLGKLIGTTTERIINEVTELLTNPLAYQKMARGVSPYGDGHAAERIVCTVMQSNQMQTN